MRTDYHYSVFSKDSLACVLEFGILKAILTLQVAHESYCRTCQFISACQMKAKRHFAHPCRLTGCILVERVKDTGEVVSSCSPPTSV